MLFCEGLIPEQGMPSARPLPPLTLSGGAPDLSHGIPCPSCSLRSGTCGNTAGPSVSTTLRARLTKMTRMDWSGGMKGRGEEKICLRPGFLLKRHRSGDLCRFLRDGPEG
jgi:hypothetical protein